MVAPDDCAPHIPFMARFILICLFLLWGPFSSNALFAYRETTPVPVDRVLANLTTQLASKTNDFELLHVIARLHSLSYSRAASNWVVDVVTNKAAANYSESFDAPQLERSGFPPEKVERATDPVQAKAAQNHLNEAIAYYKQAIAVNRHDEIVRIGLGWCQLQAGMTNEAKETLRAAVKLAWAKEKRAGSTMWATTNEAIGYLRPLLDRKTDKKEIDRLTRINKQAFRLGRAVTPLVFPLQPNLTVSDLIHPTASVAFDLDGSGVADRNWQWITTNAAWIVYLPQGGSVTSALQLSGNVTFWMFWENGYHALASLDNNADGLLSGDELTGIQLWQDRNSDGICTPEELMPLAQAGVTAFETHYASENSILTNRTGAHFRDGSTRPTYDIVLHAR